uniref:Uncharacterized protein n=1 Tax=Polynucleobacter necessarius subsp. necessarius (strain STIR1) TaxID=452638 RepID=B1XUP0_POLNS
MRLIRNLQLWLSLGKEIWERNRGQNLKQIAASLAFTTTVMTLAVIEGAFNQIFKVSASRPLYKKLLSTAQQQF